MEMNKGILDEVRRIVGCLYISDLHDSSRFEQVKKAVARIEPGSYDDKEWRETYEYVTGQKLKDETEQQIRALFEKI